MSYNRKISIIQIVMYLILAYFILRIHSRIVVFSPFVLMLLIKVFQIATNKWKLAWGSVIFNIVFVLFTAVNLNRLWYIAVMSVEDCVAVFAVTIFAVVISVVLDVVTVVKGKNA